MLAEPPDRVAFALRLSMFLPVRLAIAAWTPYGWADFLHAQL